mmetsp:Transcript_38993/g.93857  ORF Transcript_38993/g.93857 Transcript_38993/m.93857 type:complete len:223 (+) Transcript_38993:928-1596(+)
MGLGEGDAARRTSIPIDHSTEGVLLVLPTYSSGPPLLRTIAQCGSCMDVRMFPQYVRGDDSLDLFYRDRFASDGEIVRDGSVVFAGNQSGRAVSVTRSEAEKHPRPPRRHVYKIVVMWRIRLQETQARVRHPYVGVEGGVRPGLDVSQGREVEREVEARALLAGYDDIVADEETPTSAIAARFVLKFYKHVFRAIWDIGVVNIDEGWIAVRTASVVPSATAQ